LTLLVLIFNQIFKIWQNIGATDWRNASPEARAYNLSQGRKAAELGMASLEENLSNQRWSNNLLVANIANSLLDAESKTILNKYLDEQQLAELNIKAANYEYSTKFHHPTGQYIQTY
jgi:hypothetical protein